MTFISRVAAFLRKSRLQQKEIGYHAFNLYALALIASHIPDGCYSLNNKLRSAMAYIDNKEFISGLENNHYAYPYNPCGFEVAYALQIFGDFEDQSRKTLQWWVGQQIERTYDVNTSSFNINTADANTLTARVYEATRLVDTEIRVKLN